MSWEILCLALLVMLAPLAVAIVGGLPSGQSKCAAICCTLTLTAFFAGLWWGGFLSATGYGVVILSTSQIALATVVSVIALVTAAAELSGLLRSKHGNDAWSPNRRPSVRRLDESKSRWDRWTTK